jgi:hypothetical protein
MVGVLTVEITASTSETSANLYRTTRCCNSGDSHLHIFRRENLNTYKFLTDVMHYNETLLLFIILYIILFSSFYNCFWQHL